MAAGGSQRTAVEAAAAPAAIGAYSHAVRAGGLLFCSGQLGFEPQSGELIEGGAGPQAERCLRNLAAVCEAAGAGLEDAVRITLYVVHLERDWDAVNERYAAFFGDGEPPARVTVGVAALPRGALVEADAVVALGG
jgi:2-iminobutanoate/2-iminopropanoate deaminase